MALSSPIDCRLYRSHSCVAHFSVSFPHYTTFPSIGTASYIVTYDGTIKAGINLSDAVVEVDEESHTITIILPPSKITDNNVPQESVVTHNIKNGLFNDVTYEDLNNLVAQGKIRMEVKAVERGLLTKADEEARTLVKSFLSLIPGIGSGEGEYTLIVQTSS